MSQTITDQQPGAFVRERILRPGNTNCGGCGMSVGLNYLDAALKDTPLTLCIPACCGIVTAGGFPSSGYGVPTLATTFASCPAVATGVEAINTLNRDPDTVVCWAGDGGTYDIGVASLSAAAERNENLIYICYDNEIYGNTGGQRSSATPECAFTSTTPAGKSEPKKDIVSILAAHGIPYAATLSVAHPDDFRRKIQTAAALNGFKFLLMHSPCPTGWKSEAKDSIDLVRVAVKCGLFPVYEVFEGRRYRINVEPDGTSPDSYFDRQGRFKLDAEDKKQIARQIQRRWDFLHKMAQAFPAEPGDP